MSCVESRILSYLDGRLKEAEQREMEKHLGECSACSLRVKEFRVVGALLEELPQIAPSEGFDARVRARVAAEPVKQNWWAWLAPRPRVAFAALMLLAASLWVGWYSTERVNVANPGSEMPAVSSTDLPVLENYDVLANFEPLTELPQPVQAEAGTQPPQTM